jgi:hypothetical protein
MTFWNRKPATPEFSWDDAPYMVHRLTLYKVNEDTGEERFYTTNENFDHSEIAEWNYNENNVTEITVDEA